MDTHDEEYGRLLRKQMEADKKAAEFKPYNPKDAPKSSLQWPSESSIKHRLHYVLDTLQTMLRNELIAKQQADEFLDGSEGVQTYYAKSTKEAFEESRRLAIERITQLEIALNFFKQA